MANRNGSSIASRCHVVLVPGFGGFDALGRVKYYAGITSLFQDWRRKHPRLPVVLHYFDNLPTVAVVTRATRLRKYLAKRMARGEILPTDRVVLVGHSTGGLDIRQLICDLHDRKNARTLVDGGCPVRAQDIRDRIQRVVFLSVPHWGTNIAEWVYSNSILRRMVITNLQAAIKASQVYLVDQVEAGLAEEAARWAGTDVLLALRDALVEANANWNGPGATQVADAQEADSELELYFRQMASDFHVINDLTPEPHNCVKSPAHFSAEERKDELALWAHPRIDTRSYATVGGRAFQFQVETRSPAPVFDLVDPICDLDVALGCGSSASNDLSYRLCYRACAGGPLPWPKPLGKVAKILEPRPPLPLELWDNDGIVNTVSMLWPQGETVLVQADHLDIVGHYVLRPRDVQSRPCSWEPPPGHDSYDTLRSAPHFRRNVFEQVWEEIFSFATRGVEELSNARRCTKTLGERGKEVLTDRL